MVTLPAIPTSAVIGARVDVAETATETARFALGTQVELTGGGKAVYIKATAAITGEGYAAIVDKDFNAAMVSTVNAVGRRGDLVGFAQAAIPLNGFGWLVYEGATKVWVAATAAGHIELNVTAVPGQLDDDATATRQVIDGVVLTVANGGAAALVEGKLVGGTKVGRTL